VVSKDSLENVLASAGVNAQGASSRIAAWAKACERASTDPLCQKGVTSLASFVVTVVEKPTGQLSYRNYIPLSNGGATTTKHTYAAQTIGWSTSANTRWYFCELEGR